MTPPPAPPAIRFDQEAAETAAHELLVTAESLIEALSVMDADRTITTEDWEGRFRTTFDAEIESKLAGGAFLASLLQQMAAAIRSRAWQAEAATLAREEALEDDDG